MTQGIVTTEPYVDGNIVSGETIVSDGIVAESTILESPSDNPTATAIEETITSSVAPVEPPADLPLEEK